MKGATKLRLVNENKYVIVYKLDFAMALMAKGHKVACTMPNPANQNLITWAFELDDTIRQELDVLRGGGSV